MYEPSHQRPISRLHYGRRLLAHLLAALGLLSASLLAGMCGYHFLEGLGWEDAFLNAAMLLGGMGPVDPLQTEAGKWLAGSYALLAGLVVLVVTGVMLAPVVHHVLGHYGFDEEGGGAKPGK